MIDIPAIFVLHVRCGYEDRNIHIRSMMQRLRLPFEFMLDGDIPLLDDRKMRMFFPSEGLFSVPSAAVSCSCKHLLAYRQILERGLDGAVILEDDIILSKNFETVLGKSLEELPSGEAAIISFEDSRLRFVPGSMRCKGVVLYPGPHDRLAGAYYITSAAAKAILDYVYEHKLDEPIDIFHTTMLKKGLLKYYWTYPCVASQGSFSGLFASSLSPDRGKAAIWKLKRLYRRLLYRLR